MCHVTKPMAALAMRGTLLRAAARGCSQARASGVIVRSHGQNLFGDAPEDTGRLAWVVLSIDVPDGGLWTWRTSDIPGARVTYLAHEWHTWRTSDIPGARVTKLCVARCSG